MTQRNQEERDAILFCHGLLFAPGLSADRVYKIHFAKKANSPHAGHLSRAKVREMFKQFGKTKVRRGSAKTVEDRAREKLLRTINVPEEERRRLSQTRVNT